MLLFTVFFHNSQALNSSGEGTRTLITVSESAANCAVLSAIEAHTQAAYDLQTSQTKQGELNCINSVIFIKKTYIYTLAYCRYILLNRIINVSFTRNTFLVKLLE